MQTADQLYTFLLPKNLKTELEKICKEEHEPLSVVIRRALKAFVKSQGVLANIG